MKKIILVFLITMLPGIAFGKATGDVAAGKAVYKENCARCHGETGAGDGTGGANMFPKPRDFTTGIFKFQTSTFNEKKPLDRDIYQTVSDGLPGSAMPAWKSSLSSEARWNVVAYVKQLARITGESTGKINYDGWAPPTKKNLKEGKKLFSSRCAACHGEKGRGDTTMPLEDEWGERVWPRNFTKYYSFRVGNAPMEIYARISAGIPGTPMPSFDDPEMGDDKLNNEQKWMVANYVNSLEDRQRVFRKKLGKIVDAWYSETLPEDIEDFDPWKFSKPLTFGLVTRTAPGRPPLNSLIDTVTVRALNNGKEVALLMEWDDPSKSIAGDDDASTIIGDEDVFDDAVAVYMPAGIASEKTSKPFFGLGDEKKPVNVLYVSAEEKKKKFVFTGSESFNASAKANPCNPCATNPCAKNVCNPCAGNACNPCGKKGDSSSMGVDSSILMQAMYNSGRWTVYMKRPIGSLSDKDAKLEVGKATPIALSIWDGSNNEKGLTHTFSDWYWLNILSKGKGGKF